jgi:hypothetical protein
MLVMVASSAAPGVALLGDPTDSVGSGRRTEWRGAGDFDLTRLERMERRLQSLEDAEAVS